MKQTYSIKEATEVLGIGKTKMYELANSGEIPVIKIGSRTLISKKVIDNLINPESNFHLDRILHEI
jgi:excisionase family DNA binding protein